MKPSEKQKIISSWTNFFDEKSIPKGMEQAYLRYASNLLDHDGCIIMDAEHLSFLLGMDKSDLYKMVYGTDSYYRTFSIKKRSGGNREICTPYPSLKYIQRWIYENILLKQKVNGCAHGFRAKRSILSNVKFHLNKRYLLKLNLKDFFPSIKINKVVQVFKEIGYSKEVAFILSSLCCLEGELRQGAPTSPALSNIVFRQTDKRLFLLAKKFGYHYTRYADDIAFSGDEIPIAFIGYVKTILENSGYTINKNKTKLYHEDSNKILTGIRIADDTMRLPREKRRKYKQEIYYTLKYGIDVRVDDGVTFSTYIASQLGKANFWHMIEPNNDFVNKAIPKLKALYETAIGYKNE